jgi:putative ABC transport system permease protein
MNVFLRIAFRNTLKNWRKSLAAIASIAVAFLSLVLFQGYILNVNAMYQEGFTSRAMYGNLIIENKKIDSEEARLYPEKFHVTKEQQTFVQDFLDRHSQDVVTRVRFLPVTGTVTNGRNSFLFVAMGHDVAEGRVMREPHWVWDALYGKPLHLAEDKNSAVLGQSLGYLVGCVPTDPQANMVQNDGYVAEVRPFTCETSTLQFSTTTMTGQVNAMDLSVVGLIDGGYKDVDQRWAKISLETAQTLMNTNQIRFISMKLQDEKKVHEFTTKMNSEFASAALPLVAMDWMDHRLASLYKQTQSLLQVFHIFIICIILVIVGLSVFNTMVKNVKERTREIGMLRSLGYRPSDISMIFSLEAAATCFVGVGAGLILALVTTTTVNGLKILYRAGLLSMPVIFRIAYDFQGYIVCGILLVVLSVVTSYFAVRSTLRAKVAENLTHA